MQKIAEKPMVGGKALGLQFLKENGFLVPKYVVLSQDILNDEDSLVKQLSAIAMSSSDSNLWAVRSSASVEDGNERSYAGQFRTLLNLKSDELIDGVRSVIQSYSDTDRRYGVIIQEMIQPEIAGVIFSKDPVDLISSDAVLSVVPGLASKLVNSEVEGCTIRISNASISSIEEGRFTGYFFSDGQQKAIELTHDAIKQIVGEHLREFIAGISKLELLLDYPVDVEFAIARNKLYWLQQRPITSRNFISYSSIWDKSASEVSFPGITHPLSCSINNRNIGLTFKKVDKAIGYKRDVLKLSEPFYNQMSGEISGALYYNVTSWQSLIYQLPFGEKYANQLPLTWGMQEMTFPIPNIRHNGLRRFIIAMRLTVMLLSYKKYRRRYNSIFQDINHRIESINFDQMSSSDLLDMYQRIEDELTSHYFAPISNGYFAMIAFTRLKSELRKTNILDTYPNFANDILMNRSDMISVESVHELCELLDVIVENRELQEMIQTKNAKGILSEIRENYNNLFLKIEAYISKHGHRAPGGDFKIEMKSFKDDILVFIEYLKSNSVHYKKRSKNLDQFDYKGILKQLLRLKLFKRKRIERLINKTIIRTRDRELYRYQRAEAFAISRKVFREIGQKLVTEGRLNLSTDITFLTFEELIKSSNDDDFKSIVQKRKIQYEAYTDENMPSTYVEAKGKKYPVHSQVTSSADGQIQGVGCCSGEVTGEVLLVDANTDLEQDFSDYILLGLYFEPGQMNLISTAKGIISERGNLLSHTAILCREMEIPTIVGAKGATKSIEDNSVVRMNGSTGNIEIISDELV